MPYECEHIAVGDAGFRGKVLDETLDLVDALPVFFAYATQQFEGVNWRGRS